MKNFSEANLPGLIDEQEGSCVSLYLPTHPIGEEGKQDPICIHNLLSEAQRLLVQRGMDAEAAQAYLKPIWKRTENVQFWEGRSRGLALFLSPGQFRAFRLPVRMKPRVIVGPRFYVLPLLSPEVRMRRYLVLTLSQQQIRLFAACQHTIEPVDVPHLPEGMPQALNVAGGERELQVHSAGFGQSQGIFHGHGGAAEHRKEELREYFRLVDKALQPVLAEQQLPLVLAGVGYLLPIYHRVNSYCHTVSVEVTGNWDQQGAQSLRREAWEAMRGWFLKQQDEVTQRYAEKVGQGQTTADLHKILPAVEQGRVETLFVDPNELVWGQYRATTWEVIVHDSAEADDEELLNLAAIEVIRHHGQVFAVPRDQIPGGEFIAAALRY